VRRDRLWPNPVQCCVRRPAGPAGQGLRRCGPSVMHRQRKIEDWRIRQFGQCVRCRHRVARRKNSHPECRRQLRHRPIHHESALRRLDHESGQRDWDSPRASPSLDDHGRGHRLGHLAQRADRDRLRGGWPAGVAKNAQQVAIRPAWAKAIRSAHAPALSSTA
jgi:hypothetical protein